MNTLLLLLSLLFAPAPAPMPIVTSQATGCAPAGCQPTCGNRCGGKRKRRTPVVPGLAQGPVVIADMEEAK